MCGKSTIYKAEGIALVIMVSVRLTIEDFNVKIEVGTGVMAVCSFLKLGCKSGLLSVSKSSKYS